DSLVSRTLSQITRLSWARKRHIGLHPCVRLLHTCHRLGSLRETLLALVKRQSRWSVPSTQADMKDILEKLKPEKSFGSNSILWRACHHDRRKILNAGMLCTTIH
ncbi:unnamed protein product, partial [Ectocarpus sp. 12 AP-2014]